ncbi:MAG: hypothetical protein JW920_11840, partial [Deltaproteobacteria bacterium]|nr:hypothetical protein [Deltaproteobacteria bacterium]
MKNRCLIFMCILLLGLFLYGCNSSSSSDGAKSSQSQVAQQEDGDDTTPPEEEPPEEPPVEPPIEITGSYTISAMGGASTLGGGGLAGSIEVSACEDVSFLKSGTVDADFVVPMYPIEESLGPYPLVITGAQTVVVDPDSGGPDGLLYMLSGDPNLYISDGDNYLGSGDDNEIVVTGLKVMPGGVLVFGLNYDSNDIDEDDDVTTGQDTAALVFTYDVIIQGTVVTAPLASAYMPDSYYPEDRGSLWIQHTYDPHGLYHIAHFVLGPNGVILTAGVDADVQDDRGGDAGDVGIYEFDGCFLDGLIDASGGDGICDGDGGYGGCVDILSFGTMVSTGIIDTSGGDGSNGGDAG